MRNGIGNLPWQSIPHLEAKWNRKSNIGIWNCIKYGTEGVVLLAWWCIIYFVTHKCHVMPHTLKFYKLHDFRLYDARMVFLSWNQMSLSPRRKSFWRMKIHNILIEKVSFKAQRLGFKFKFYKYETLITLLNFIHLLVSLVFYCFYHSIRW